MENLYIELIQWRSIERLMSITIGGLSIAAGWHLFLRGVVQEQSADINAQNLKVSLQKVGPGIFFALFGAWIIINIATTQASLEGLNIPGVDAKENDKQQTRLVFLSGSQDAWQMKFVAATKRLDADHGLLSQALAKLDDDDPDKIWQIKTAISELSLSRKKFLQEAFPPNLRDACRDGTPIPTGFTQDNCELMKEYENAISN